jgi:protein TonB
MFEDSLVESQGRIRTKSKWFAIGSFLAQAALLLLLILLPLFHPQALPKQSLQRLLTAPQPPRAPAQLRTTATTAARPPLLSLEAQLRAPGRIPSHLASATEPGPPAGPLSADISGSTHDGILDGMNLGSPAPRVAIAKPPAPRQPLAVSSGVAAGLLLHPIQPVYPAIAKAARIQGTVVIEATISRLGTIGDLRVTEGPPMLRQAAIDAVAKAQYRPFLLNGEPIEVQTSIRVVFSMGN